MSDEERFRLAVLRATFIPGMVWPREMYGLRSLLSESSNHVEIGTFCGKSLYITAAAMGIFGPKQDNKTITVVENFSEKFPDGSELVPSLNWWRSVLNATVKVIEDEYGIAIHFVDNTSMQAAVEQANQKQFDSIYIDANHWEEFVAQDIASWWPLLRHNGTMAGHDYSADRLGVMNAVNNAFGDGFDVIPNTRLWHARKSVSTNYSVANFAKTL